VFPRQWSRVVGLAVTLAACVIATEASAADPILLGAILPLTGPAGVIGTQEQRGLQFAIDEINAKGGVGGHPIQIQFEDNQAKPDQSVLSFNKLVDLQHVAVVFSGFSGPTLAMAPLATRKKVLLVNAGAQADKLADASPYLINTLPTIADEIAVLAKYLTDEGKKTVAILFENDAAGISGRDDYLKFFPAAGAKIVAQEPSQFGQTDFRPPLLKLADSKPDVVLLAITAGLLQLAQQYRQLELKFLVAGTTFMADPPTIADASSKGFLHTQVRIDAPADLAANFQKKYAADMDFFAKQYYNAATVVLTSLAKVVADKKEITGETVRQAVFDIRKFQGLIPMEFKTNTAATAIDINIMRDSKDERIKEMKPQ
jgi:branched-chain amino acid transport system substrate-binding protein